VVDPAIIFTLLALPRITGPPRIWVTPEKYPVEGRSVLIAIMPELEPMEVPVRIQIAPELGESDVLRVMEPLEVDSDLPLWTLKDPEVPQVVEPEAITMLAPVNPSVEVEELTTEIAAPTG